MVIPTVHLYNVKEEKLYFRFTLQEHYSQQRDIAPPIRYVHGKTNVWYIHQTQHLFIENLRPATYFGAY